MHCISLLKKSTHLQNLKELLRYYRLQISKAFLLVSKSKKDHLPKIKHIAQVILVLQMPKCILLSSSEAKNKHNILHHI
jgi:hypothetical protein